LAQGLKDRIVAVTGGGQGIGRAIALRLAREGAHLALADTNEETAKGVAGEIAALGRRSLAVPTDVCRKAECERMVERVVETFGRLDVLFCNAGIIQVKRVFDITEEDWDRMFAVNCKGVFFTLQAGARQMLRQNSLRPGGPRGKIINTSSIAGRYGGGRPWVLHYAASKASVISITQTAAMDLAPHVTVNAICPGIVDTAMWKALDEQWSNLQGWERGEAWRRRVATIPMGRPEIPEDVAGLAAFLASSDSDYMTGQTLNIEGGLVFS
jgi:meso-butanediol dehydrogenase/(S,S)-butanediol dehydrogenase/diacetyl reductase